MGWEGRKGVTGGGGEMVGMYLDFASVSRSARSPHLFPLLSSWALLPLFALPPFLPRCPISLHPLPLPGPPRSCLRHFRHHPSSPVRLPEAFVPARSHRLASPIPHDSPPGLLARSPLVEQPRPSLRPYLRRRQLAHPLRRGYGRRIRGLTPGARSSTRANWVSLAMAIELTRK